MSALYWQSRLFWETSRRPILIEESAERSLAQRLLARMAQEKEEAAWHVPVLLQEAAELLVADPDGLYLDGTVGLGGHAAAVLSKLSPKGKLLGVDLDPEALAEAQTRLNPFAGRCRLVSGNFRDAAAILEREKFFPLSGALLDLGVSSLQLGRPRRGFSFMFEGPLDMRMSPSNPLTAAAIVNNWPEEQMSLIFSEYGEEPAAGRLAASIVRRRSRHPFESTADLAEHISRVLPRRGGQHPATKAFMALRIAVNTELENLTRGLEGILSMTGHRGRIAVISFHSLEDRIVKKIFLEAVSRGVCRWVSRKAVRPSREETARNPRARSAKLRVAEKI